MTLDAFKGLLDAPSPPSDLPPLLLALWHDARGDWAAAHKVAQAVDDADGAWVHAYLHRKEGDPFNAGYWYRRAGRPVCREPLTREWAEITEDLVARIDRMSTG